MNKKNNRTRSIKSYAINTVLRRTVRRWFTEDIDVHALRNNVSWLSGRLHKMPSNIQVREGQISGLKIEWFSCRESNKDNVILYLHGGGFILPAFVLHNNFCAYLAEATRSLVVMPSYRLAPEHPFPAAPEDCLSTYLWLLEKGYKAENITIAGDSAGGNLALVTLMQIRDLGLPMPNSAVLMSPLTDFNFETKSFDENKYKDSCFAVGAAPLIRDRYLQDYDNLNDFRLSPLKGDFSGLPPMLYFVGSTELLRDDSVHAVFEAKQQGVDAEVSIWKEMPHVFPLIHILPEGLEASQEIARFINFHMANNAVENSKVVSSHG